ncbi:MAG: acetylornithine deacetylase or succinyl-diaminopimelate desuccinylase [Frankiales bacterium]|nr:acetylornithine deacetylase or succinyl-diaminopimelate desuccinylase [Frankiales bacterium]
MPSVTGSAAEGDAQQLLASRLRAAGMDTDLWEIDLPSITADPEFPGMEAARVDAWGLVSTMGGDEGPTLVLNGHIDVVPTGDRRAWTVDPWSGSLRDGAVLGRGACDMKGGLACQVMAATVLAEAGVPLRGRLSVQSVVGEEDGGLGTFATVRRGHTGDAAVVCEPTSLAVIPAAAGALTFRLVIRGTSAHASVRDEGVDVLDVYVRVHAVLRELEARRNVDVHPLMRHRPTPYPISVGTLRAGEWPSSVPDLLVAEGRLGVALEESVEDARADLVASLATIGHPVEVEWYGGQFAPGMLPAGSPLLQQVSDIHAAMTGELPVVQGVPYGSDLRLLIAAGIPTVHYGPGDVRRAHAPDESVPVAELVQVTEALVLLAAELLGVR